jgi:abortive infection bacteriophage resistance protein
MPRVPYDKPALDFAAQLKQLKDRGLNVENEDKALHLLEKISYFRLTSYWYPMLKDPKSEKLFKPDSSFNNAFKLYCFDRELRKLVSGGHNIKINNRTYSLLSMIIYLLNIINPSYTFKNKLAELFAKYSNVDLRAIGYPEGWEKESMWSN